MTLKQLRINKGLRQAKCADILQVSLRTYKRYESNENCNQYCQVSISYRALEWIRKNWFVGYRTIR